MSHPTKPLAKLRLLAQGDTVLAKMLSRFKTDKSLEDAEHGWSAVGDLPRSYRDLADVEG